MPDTNRPPLSPAAQAVRNAAIAAEPGQTIAAALRAAADQIVVKSIWRGHPEHAGVRWAAEAFRIIAAELEGAA